MARIELSLLDNQLIDDGPDVLDIVRNKKTVAQAREYYARAIKESMSGKMDPYMQKLQFTAQSRTADADQPAKMMSGDMGSRKEMSSAIK